MASVPATKNGVLSRGLSAFHFVKHFKSRVLLINPAEHFVKTVNVRKNAEHTSQKQRKQSHGAHLFNLLPLLQTVPDPQKKNSRKKKLGKRSRRWKWVGVGLDSTISLSRINYPISHRI
jgi:hypothetical protein